VPRTGKKFSQYDAGTLGGTGPLRVFRMSENADEAVLNQWASGPANAAMFLEEGVHWEARSVLCELALKRARVKCGLIKAGQERLNVKGRVKGRTLRTLRDRQFAETV
jgi:hypothetical protein